MKSIFVLLFTALLTQSAISEADTVAITIYVSQAAEKQQDGSKDHPFDSLEKARDHLREIRDSDSLATSGAFVICVRAGEYLGSAPFKLEKEDSGTWADHRDTWLSAVPSKKSRVIYLGSPSPVS